MARITVVETVYYHPSKGQPHSIESRYGKELECNDQPYSRTVSIGKKWKKIDHGWVNPLCVSSVVIINNGKEVIEIAVEVPNVVDIYIKNDTNKDYNIPMNNNSPPHICEHPTPANNIIHPMILLLPGESLRVQPIDITNWLLRSTVTGSQVIVTVFPL